MLKIKNISKFVIFIFLSIAIVFLIIYSDICKIGIERGIMLCGNVIIPSLFPFTVCILIIMKMDFRLENKFLSKVLRCIFGQNFDMFFTMLFSFVAGYPIGCKLINELYLQNKIDIKTANIMQMYCVNAGPAFIISAVGVGVLHSEKIGIILFVSHIASSLIIAFFTAKFTKINFKKNTLKIEKNKNFSEIFVNASADAAASVMSICVYVILFSCSNSYLVYFLKDVPIFKNIVYFTEVTSSITFTKNIVFISFLLGFSGLSIWCQIFSISKNAKPNFKLFVLGRMLHGGISALLTCTFLRIFNIKQSVFSNAQNYQIKTSYGNIALSISLLIMLIVLSIYIYSKNCSGKLLDDVI